MQVPRYRHAVFIALLALVGAMLSAAPAMAAGDCPSGQTQYKIDSSPSNGTYGDGTLSVTISNVDEDSFSWSSNITVTSVMVKGGPVLKSNPGGRSGSATSPDNPNNGKRYGISHVSFCYSVDDEGGKQQEIDEDDCEERNGGKKCDEEPDCPEKGNGKGNGNMKDCDEEEEEECPDGTVMGSNGKCQEVDKEECPDGTRMGSNGKCEELKDEDCPNGRRMGSTGPECDETLGDVDKKPARPGVIKPPARRGGRVGSAAQPRTEVRGLQFSDRGDNSVSADARPQVQGQQEPGGALPLTGGAILTYILMGLGLVSAGALMWRRRQQN